MFFLCLPAGFLLLAACTIGSTQALSKDDAGKTIELDAGETFRVVLPGNPTTGFAWQVATDSTAPVSLIGEPSFKAESNAVGAGGMVTLAFKAENSGEGRLKLAYFQPWEAGTPPADTFEVNLIVR